MVSEYASFSGIDIYKSASQLSWKCHQNVNSCCRKYFQYIVRTSSAAIGDIAYSSNDTIVRCLHFSLRKEGVASISRDRVVRIPRMMFAFTDFRYNTAENYVGIVSQLFKTMPFISHTVNTKYARPFPWEVLEFVIFVSSTADFASLIALRSSPAQINMTGGLGLGGITMVLSR